MCYAGPKDWSRNFSRSGCWMSGLLSLVCPLSIFGWSADMQPIPPLQRDSNPWDIFTKYLGTELTLVQDPEDVTGGDLAVQLPCATHSPAVGAQSWECACCPNEMPTHISAHYVLIIGLLLIMFMKCFDLKCSHLKELIPPHLSLPLFPHKHVTRSTCEA